MQCAPKVQRGVVTPGDQLTQKLLPFNVPVGTTSIHVKYTYTGRDTGNAIDLGLLEVGKQFRGYSGGSKFDITVANDEASAGYIAGPLPPGEWYVVLGIYHISSSSASYEVETTVDDSPRSVFKANPAPARAEFSTLKRPPGVHPIPSWLKGDFHTHTIHSDGKFSLDELVDKALKRGLDFIFSTEHNTLSANLVWGNHVPKGFLVGRGIEVTTFRGHWNAIGLLPYQLIDPVIHDHADIDASLIAAVEEVHKSDGFAVINHPFAECKCCGWSFSFHESMGAIEVWNGPWKRHPNDQSNVRAVKKWDEMLRQGKIFTALGGSDIHEPHFEIAEPVTKVLTNEVSVNSIIRGLRARHVYVTQHPCYEIDFHLYSGGQRADIGDWLETSDEDTTVSVSITGFPRCKVVLITEMGIAHVTSETNVAHILRARYVRVEVRDTQDEMLGITNPIWIL